MRYVLGVDGGNTKTDYLLYDTQGNRRAHLRAGTCSHENLGMDGARHEMGRQIAALLQQAGADRAAVAASAFGLAGIDNAGQKAALTDILHALGFANCVAANDSILGIKAGSESGVGVCSVNGTGTVAGGIDAQGRWAQVGGYGTLSGDEGGGTYLAGKTLRAAYDEIFRFGPQTLLTPRVLALFGCDQPDDFHTAVSVRYQYGDDVSALQAVRLLLAASDEGDPVARGIVEYAADSMARTAAGCAARLHFEGDIPVVLVGSVWTKGRNAPMLDHFAARFSHYAGQGCSLLPLDAPPAVGSILWALEIAYGQVPTGALRARVFESAAGL